MGGSIWCRSKSTSIAIPTLISITCTPGRGLESENDSFARDMQHAPGGKFHAVRIHDRHSCPIPSKGNLNGIKTTFVLADNLARGNPQESCCHLANVPVLGTRRTGGRLALRSSCQVCAGRRRTRLHRGGCSRGQRAHYSR